MTHKQHALATILARDHFSRTAQAEDHVAPAFAAGWTMVELSKQPAEFGLIGVIRFDANLCEAVENSEFLFAQPFVNDKSVFVLRQPRRLCHYRRSITRTQIRRSKNDVWSLLWRQRSKPSSERLCLLSAEIR